VGRHGERRRRADRPAYVSSWGVDLDPEFLDLIDQEFDPATDLPWLQA
jgi:hypothetical protein